MFTGIVQGVGHVAEIEKTSTGCRLCVRVPPSFPVKQVNHGSSVSVSGVCLTVNEKKQGILDFSVMRETLKKTTLGSLQKGDMVHLEPSVRLGDEIGGHFVYGHVDLTVEVKSQKACPERQSNGSKVKSRELTFEMPKSLKKYIVPQGSVTIDGVSLTVARVGRSDFTVSLVEYTLEHTALKYLKKGDRVNVECDMIAKYAIRIRKQRE